MPNIALFIDTTIEIYLQYLGKWYEIERYEQDFQRNLECVTAEYTQSKLDESLDVKSKGFLASKDAYASFAGIAVMSDPLSNPAVGKLNVTYGIKGKDFLDIEYICFNRLFVLYSQRDLQLLDCGHRLRKVCRSLLVHSNRRF